MSPLVVK